MHTTFPTCGAVTWTRDGRQTTFTDSPADLVGVWVERIKGCLNINKDSTSGLNIDSVAEAGGGVWATKEVADGASTGKRIACIEIDVPEGQGLEGEAGR